MQTNAKITILKEMTYPILVKTYQNQEVTKIMITVTREPLVTSGNYISIVTLFFFHPW